MSELPAVIGINSVFLEPGMGGLETYVRELIPELLRAASKTRFVLYASASGAAHLRQDAWIDEVRVVTHPLLGLPGLKALSELTLLGVLASRQVDLLHSVAMTAPLRTRAVNVVLIPDVIWLRDEDPDATVRLWRAVVPRVARRADRLMAISQSSAQEIVDDLHIPATRIDVTPLGHADGRRAAPLEVETVRRRFGLGDGPVVLFVGTRKPHKNVLGLIEAMPEILREHPTAMLVLAGNPTAHEDALTARVAQLGLGDRVAVLPYVSDEELEGLYATAACFVLPSFHEGFGLPILEAMGRGVPVACSDVSALPEVAGGAAVLFDPTRTEAIATAVDRLLGDESLRRRMITAGLTRQRSQSWTATAEATLESYARAWSQRTRGRA